MRVRMTKVAGLIFGLALGVGGSACTPGDDGAEHHEGEGSAGYEFVWGKDGDGFEGRLSVLPGEPNAWGLLDLPDREGRTRLAASRVDTVDGRLVLVLPDPEGSLSVGLEAPGSGRLIIRQDTFEISDFRPSDTPLESSVVALVGVDPVEPGILSTDEAEEFPSFTPSGDTIYLTRRFQTILQSVRQDGQWSGLVAAPFGSRFRDRAAEVSPDGTALYLTSNRPGPGEERESDDRNHDLWRLDRDDQGGWTNAERLPDTVNSDSADYHASVTLDHTLYFSSWSRPGGYGRSDLYRAVWTEDGYTPAENLGPVINGAGSESDVFVDPRERYIIFVSTDRDDSLGGDDLYMSYRTDGTWSVPRNLGRPVNSFSYEYGPTVSRDGQWLYFTSHRRGSADLYRVPLGTLLDPSAELD